MNVLQLLLVHICCSHLNILILSSSSAPIIHSNSLTCSHTHPSCLVFAPYAFSSSFFPKLFVCLPPSHHLLSSLTFPTLRCFSFRPSIILHPARPPSRTRLRRLQHARLQHLQLHGISYCRCLALNSSQRPRLQRASLPIFA